MEQAKEHGLRKYQSREGLLDFIVKMLTLGYFGVETILTYAPGPLDKSTDPPILVFLSEAPSRLFKKQRILVRNK